MSGKPLVRVVAGRDGCRLAAETRAIAIIVDAMRMSAMLCTLLHIGVTKVHVVRGVSEARALAKLLRNAMLVGERKSVKPKGFDLSNSPTEALKYQARKRAAVFTSTTGAQRLHEALGACTILIGTAVNASSVASVAEGIASERGCDVVIIPAGRSDNPALPSDEDWYASAAIASRMSIPVCDEQREIVAAMWDEIKEQGLKRIFSESLHGQQLISLGLKEDVELCAQLDMFSEVPWVKGVEEFEGGVRSVLVGAYTG